MQNGPSRHAPVATGLDIVARERPAWLCDRRVGLLTHPAAVAADLRPARQVIHALCGDRLAALFGPQHGFGGERQDNMVESAHAVDSEFGIPVHSLYSETRSPTAAMLEGIDLLLIDLQDVGTRVYTFVWTAALALAACAEAGREVVVLDRPNPIGGERREGAPIRPGYQSFVGLHPVPMRHGLTLGEFCLWVNRRLGESGSCNLRVVPMDGWRRSMSFPDTGLPWVLPSPNLPTFDTAVVYPGQVLFEGTNLSEGRGTTRPFELFGAPWIDPVALHRRFVARNLPGLQLREVAFEPTFHKWAGETCRGFQIHVTDPAAYRPWRTTLGLLQDIIALHRDRFEWKQPPYEYVHDQLPIDVLTGDPAVRAALEAGADLAPLVEGWDREAEEFGRQADDLLLYD